MVELWFAGILFVTWLIFPKDTFNVKEGKDVF